MKKMDFGQTITVLANVGVIAGILLLAYELNQNRQMMEAQTRNELAMGLVEIQLATAADPNQLAAIVKGRQSIEPTETERLAAEFGLTALFRYWENVHYQYRVGLYDETEFATQREAWRAALTGPSPHAEFWCGRRTTYSPEFAADIDSLLGANECE